MRLKRIKWELVLFCGWLVILGLAAIILPRTGSNAIAFPVLVLMLTWLLLSVVALVFYFYRAWRRVAVVPNKAEYVAWISIHNVCSRRPRRDRVVFSYSFMTVAGDFECKTPVDRICSFHRGQSYPVRVVMDMSGMLRT